MNVEKHQFNTRDELILLLKQVKVELQLLWPIESLSLFGSWLRGDASPGSDVDLMIQFYPGTASENVGAFEFIEIQLKLQSVLGCKVDLVEKSALKPRFAKTILPEVLSL